MQMKPIAWSSAIVGLEDGDSAWGDLVRKAFKRTRKVRSHFVGKWPYGLLVRDDVGPSRSS